MAASACGAKASMTPCGQHSTSTQSHQRHSEQINAYICRCWDGCGIVFSWLIPHSLCKWHRSA
eukprot:3441917-Amphidinium_carterae.1